MKDSDQEEIYGVDYIICPECITYIHIEENRIEGYKTLVECPKCGHPTSI